MAEEGLKKTANDRISIGKPLEIDEQKLFDALNVLIQPEILISLDKYLKK